MVLPLLFALGAQFLAGATGASVLGSAALAGGLAAAGGNAVGQLVQNNKVNWGDAAIAGVGAGVASAAMPAASAVTNTGVNAAKNVAGSSLGNAAMTGAQETAKNAVSGGLSDIGKVAMSNFDKGMPVDMFSLDAMGQTAGNMVAGYTTPMGMAGGLGMWMGNTPKKMKGQGNVDKDQAEMQAKWDRNLGNAKQHEAQYNSRWYNGQDPNAWFQSRGFAEGGAYSGGLGTAAMVGDAQSQESQQVARDQTQELFDIGILIVSGKLPPKESQAAMELMNKALGPQQAQQFLQSIQDMLSQKKGKGGRVVAGEPSMEDNVMAQDEVTGEPIKLASGEAILPTEMVQAAGGGLSGAKNIVAAASQGLPSIREPAKRFMSEARQ